jgi:hypothetical protein
MTDLFSSWSARDLIGLVSVVCGSLIAITAILASHWRGVRQAELEASLKHELVERGMSVDDIERVIKARSKKC